MTDAISRAALEKAVVEATKKATQEVAKVHRRRLVLYSGLISFLAAAGIALPVTLVTTHHNCKNITALAKVDQVEAEETAAATRSFEAHSKDRLGLSQRSFEKLVREGRERRERHLAALRRVAHNNCALIP